MALRLAAESFLALAMPPLDAPSLLRARAAGFLPASRSTSGLPSICSPIACSTTRRAFVKKSRPLLARLGMLHHATIEPMAGSPMEFKLTHCRNRETEKRRNVETKKWRSGEGAKGRSPMPKTRGESNAGDVPGRRTRGEPPVVDPRFEWIDFISSPGLSTCAPR